MDFFAEIVQWVHFQLSGKNTKSLRTRARNNRTKYHKIEILQRKQHEDKISNIEHPTVP